MIKFYRKVCTVRQAILYRDRSCFTFKVDLFLNAV